jgi:hypothetical protein
MIGKPVASMEWPADGGADSGPPQSQVEAMEALDRAIILNKASGVILRNALESKTPSLPKLVGESSCS